MKIYEVTQASVIKDSQNSILSVQVSGFAASSGWTNPRLSDSNDANKEKDGILELIFEADKSTERSLPVLTPVTASKNITIDDNYSIDAVIVRSRSRDITIHSSQFITYTALATAQADSLNKVERVRALPGFTYRDYSDLTTIPTSEEEVWGWVQRLKEDWKGVVKTKPDGELEEKKTQLARETDLVIEEPIPRNIYGSGVFGQY